MNKKIIIIIFGILVLLVGSLFILKTEGVLHSKLLPNNLFGTISAQIEEDNPEVTRTSSTETVCRSVDGRKVCNLILYSGIRFVEEDGQWKKIEDARSLRNKGFNIIYLEDDFNFRIIVLDYNLTSITLNLGTIGNQFNKDIPIRIWKVNESKTELTGDFRQDYSLIKEETQRFTSTANLRKTYEFGLGNILEFGFNSTTIILQDADTENLEDAEAQEQFPDAGGNFNKLKVAQGNSNRNVRFYIKFNISGIPVGQVIDNANLSLLYDSTSNSGVFSIDINHVLDQTWDEGSLTWNNQPCPTAFNNDSLCNTTREDFQSNPVQTPDYWMNWTITQAVGRDYDAGNSNVSFVIKSATEGATTPRDYSFDSKEFATVSQRPILNITYSETPAPVVNLDSPSNNTFSNVLDQIFNSSYSATAGDLVNATLNVWNSTPSLVFNETESVTGTSNSSSINFTFSVDDVYVWNYEVCDNSVLCASNATNFTITIDTTAPTFDNLADQNADANTTFTFDIDATDTNGISCFTVNDTTNFQIDCDGVLQNNTVLSVQIYSLNISVNDSADNTAYGTMNVNVTVFDTILKWDWAALTTDLISPDQICFIFRGSEEYCIDSGTITGRWNISGTNLFPSDLSNNIGIGTSTPTHKLNVLGDSNFTENATFEKNVTILGTLFGGSPVKISGGLNVLGNLTFDTNTLFGDAVNNKVGIGTISPGAKLVVWDSTDVTSTGGGALRIGGSDTKLIAIDNNEIQAIADGGAGTLFLNEDGGTVSVHGGTDGIFQVNTLDFYVATTGNIGIGTTTPASSLHVRVATGTNDFVGLFQAGGESNDVHLALTTGFQGNDYRKTAIVAEGQGSWSRADVHFVLNNDADTTNYVLGTDTRMIIRRSGNVGIGTLTPQNLLNVLGDGNFTGNVYRNNQLLIDWSQATNGTLFTQALWDTNYTANNINWLSITNTSYALASRILTAGSGLTGGGDLTADTTFNVGAGQGITVNTDDVAVSFGTSFLGWGNLTNYPSACTSGQTITTIGDAITCSAISITESQISNLVHSDATWVTNWTDFNLTWTRTENSSYHTWIQNWTDYNTTWGTDTKEPTWLVNWTNYNVSWSSITNSSYARNDAENTFGAFNQTFDTDTFSIDSISNVVGIGTINPASQLHIYVDNADTVDSFTIEQDGTGDATMQLLLTGGQNYGIGIDNDDGDAFKIDNNGPEFGSAEFQIQANNDVLLVKSGGKVGIGTSSPNEGVEIANGALLVTGRNSSSGIVLHLNNANPPLMQFSDGGVVRGKISTGSNIITGASPTGLGIYSADAFAISTNNDGVMRMIIDNSGNMGIGTAVPNATLEVINSTTQGGFMVSSSSAGAGDLFIVDEAGNVGIGTASPSANLHISDSVVASGSTSLRIENTGTGYAQLMLKNDNAYQYNIGLGGSGTGQINDLVIYDNTAAAFRLVLTDAGNVGIGTISPSVLLEVSGASNPTFLVTDTTNTVSVGFQATDTLGVIGTSTNNDLIFETNNVEWMRIDTSGKIGIRTTSSNIDLAFGDGDTGFNQSSDGILDFRSNNVRVAGLRNDGKFYIYQVANSAADDPACRQDSGEITRGSAGCTTSSIRYKQNIQDLNYGLKEIMQLRPVSYQRKTESDRIRFGMIAEEVAKIFPEIIGYEPDDPTLIQTYDKRDVQAVLIKSIQELKSENDLMKQSLCKLGETQWC